MQDIAFEEALNFFSKFPVVKSIMHIIPSAPAV
jgi:hypothetical protein